MDNCKFCLIVTSAIYLFFYTGFGLGGAGIGGVAAFSVFWSRSVYTEIKAIVRASCLGKYCQKFTLATLPSIKPDWAGGSEDLVDAIQEHVRAI